MYNNPIVDGYESSLLTNNKPTSSNLTMANNDEDTKLTSPRPEDLPKLPVKLLSERVKCFLYYQLYIFCQRIMFSTQLQLTNVQYTKYPHAKVN